MKKIFFLVLMALLVMLAASPAHAIIVRFAGTAAVGPYGVAICYCNDSAMTCECILSLPL